MSAWGLWFSLVEQRLYSVVAGFKSPPAPPAPNKESESMMESDYDYDIHKIGICRGCGLEQNSDVSEIKMPCPKCGGFVEIEMD